MKSKTDWESANYKLKVSSSTRTAMAPECCNRLVALRPDLDLSDKPAQRRDHAQGHDAPGARILRRNAFDRHGEARRVGVDLDAVRVAGQRRIGPDFEPSLVRPDAGEAERRGDIDVGGKTARAFARAAVEDFRRRLEVFERNAAIDQIRRALKPARRLARHHGHRMDRALGGGARRFSWRARRDPNCPEVAQR